jgi:hypothetical protein
MALYVGKHGGDPSALACVGSARAGQVPYEEVAAPVGSNGYDGQFYYAIARNPWRLHDHDLIDAPAARHSRILYPVLCWLLSGGDARLLFWVMPAVNLAVLGALAAQGAAFAVRHGRSPWWGLTLPLALNAGLPALHNLTDPLSTLTVFGLLAGWLAGARASVLTAWAIAAVLSREQNVVPVGIVLLASAWRGRRGAALGMAASLVLWASWVGLLRAAYGTWPFLGVGASFDHPLYGMAWRWARPGGNDHFSRRLSIFLVASMLQLTAQIGAAISLTGWRRERVVTLCMLASVSLALVGGTGIYCDFWSYTRVFVWLPMGLWLLGLRRGVPGVIALLAPSALWPLAGALRYV